MRAVGHGWWRESPALCPWPDPREAREEMPHRTFKKIGHKQPQISILMQPKVPETLKHHVAKHSGKWIGIATQFDRGHDMRNKRCLSE